VEEKTKRLAAGAASRLQVEVKQNRLTVSATMSAAVEPTATMGSAAAVGSATVESAAAMESAATMGSAAAVEPAATIEPAAIEPAAIEPAAIETATPEAAAKPESGSSVKSAAIESPPVESVKPGTGADEEAIGEPLRTVVAIRGARIGRVVVVAILTCGRSPNISITRSYADTNRNLRLGVSRGNHQSTD
jgi:hypothetical protein